MATTNLPAPPRPSGSGNTAMMRGPPIDNAHGTNLIARAEALNAFMRMQPAANQARLAAANCPPTGPSTAADVPQVQSSCLCFGRPAPPPAQTTNRPRREYYPDNLSIQPNPHPWEDRMEWLIVACINFLEAHGLHEHNLFAVSAVDDLVRHTTVGHRAPMPIGTDPHVAAGVIKAKIRHADAPLVDKSCLRQYIEAQGEKPATMAPDDGGEHGSGTAIAAVTSSPSFRESFLCKTIESTHIHHGARRAYILARFMRLLGRVSANVESRMNAHSLAKCVAPSMLHWDPNASFALLMLGRITAYVMSMIEDARVFDENLCQRVDELGLTGAW